MDKNLEKWEKDPTEMLAMGSHLSLMTLLLVIMGLLVYGCIASLVQKDWMAAFIFVSTSSFVFLTLMAEKKGEPTKMLTKLLHLAFKIWLLVIMGLLIYGSIGSTEQEKWTIAFLFTLLLFMLTFFMAEKKEEQFVELKGLPIGTRDLFLETLTKIGCQYELPKKENTDRIVFTYKGEKFFATVSNETGYIYIYNTNWYHVELCDTEEFARLNKAINVSNFDSCVTTVYTVNETGNNVAVHSKSIILFAPQNPCIEDYLRRKLDEFFDTRNMIARLRKTTGNIDLAKKLLSLYTTRQNE